MGRDASPEALAADFDMPAVIRGFEEVSRQPYDAVLAALRRMPDGTPGENEPVFPPPPEGGYTAEIAGEPVPEGHVVVGEAHPVSCVDCHEPESMALRVTRPGFVNGIRDLAASDAPVPHLPSIERWRRGSRDRAYDPNRDATRQEMRSFTCGQCHVEYYCANRMTLTFPWAKGLRAEDLEAVWDETTFPDGTAFLDYEHGETGAAVYKVQHPEFELWSQGTHARAGVSCADCHMPYERVGAMKVSDHDVRSPMENVSASCRQCHNVPEAELVARVDTIQSRTNAMLERAASAMTEMLDAILALRAAGVADDELQEVHDLQRKAMWRLDYISSENSDGFHAAQESMRVLAESIDYSRRAQALAVALRAGEAPSIEGIETEPVYGVTETAATPVGDAEE